MRINWRALLVLTIIYALCTPAPATAGEENPVELGRVKWQRSLQSAIPLATAHDKPIFLLFQEVPGCMTCQNYGHQVLSHPLIVEAIETHFIPVAVFNNRGGEDAATLKKFGEPSWNNPVVRIVSASEQDLVPRLSGNYTRAGIVQRIITAIEKHGVPVPAYLSLLNQELTARNGNTEKSVFAMHCFWSGERMFGKLNGVLSTKPGFLQGHEVVEVEYSPDTLPFNKLIKTAKNHHMAVKVYTRNQRQQRVAAQVVGENAQTVNAPIRPDNEPKYYLSQTPLKYVPMTELQASKVNAAVGERDDFSELLSPRQLALLQLIQKHPQAGWTNVIGTSNLIDTWQQVTDKAATIRKDQGL